MILLELSRGRSAGAVGPRDHLDRVRATRSVQLELHSETNDINKMATAGGDPAPGRAGRQTPTCCATAWRHGIVSERCGRAELREPCRNRLALLNVASRIFIGWDRCHDRPHHDPDDRAARHVASAAATAARMGLVEMRFRRRRPRCDVRGRRARANRGSARSGIRRPYPRDAGAGPTDATSRCAASCCPVWRVCAMRGPRQMRVRDRRCAILAMTSSIAWRKRWRCIASMLAAVIPRLRHCVGPAARRYAARRLIRAAWTGAAWTVS